MTWLRLSVGGVMVGLITLLASLPISSNAQEKKEEKGKKGGFFKTKSWDEVVTAGTAYLKSTQADDGSWSKAAHPGITAVALTGLVKSGGLTTDDPTTAKALKFIEGYINTKEGHLAGPDDSIRHKFYTTSVNVQALKAAGGKKYDAAIDGAVKYLRQGQVGGNDGKATDDPNYGGFGYGPGTRGDLSNTHFALDAVTAVGLPKDDLIYKRATVFVSRVQNLKSEANNQPWADKINDGSFIYVLPAGPIAKDNEAARPGYGSMTYAGLKSLVLCGVSKEDQRVKKALAWVSNHYSVDINPGRQEGAGGQGYYYYLVSMARCLDTLGVDEITDRNGKIHDWRADITRALTNRQRKDGSWGNDFATWMEADPNLDTAYALIALSYTKPKAK